MSLSLPQKAAGALAVVIGRYDRKIDSELGRWQGALHVTLFDHGYLRRFWRNQGIIADGVFRANQPDRRTLADWKARGIVDVVCLRGKTAVVHKMEAADCAALGLRFLHTPMPSRAAPSVKSLLRLIDRFDNLRRPALIHCKSGADRTGLAAVIWALHVEGRPIAEARGALGLRHLHLRFTRTGVLDRLLDRYEARVAQGPIGIRDWIATEYDPTTLR